MNSFSKVAEKAFAEITKESVEAIFGISPLIKAVKLTPEKIFKVLEIYEELSKLSGHFESLFSGEFYFQMLIFSLLFYVIFFPTPKMCPSIGLFTNLGSYSRQLSVNILTFVDSYFDPLSSLFLT